MCNKLSIVYVGRNSYNFFNIVDVSKNSEIQVDGVFFKILVKKFTFCSKIFFSFVYNY